MSRSKMKKSPRSKTEKMTPQERSRIVRSITCRETMSDANWVFANDTMADVVDDLTQNDWDHVFVVNKEGVPMGRIHAVDVLKIVAKKNLFIYGDERTRVKSIYKYSLTGNLSSESTFG